MNALPDWLTAMIDSCPAAGDGVNPWLFRVSRQMHHHYSEDEIFEVLKGKCQACGRPVDAEKEIRRAIARSKPVAWKPKDGTPNGDNGAETTERQPAWPARDIARVDELVRDGFGLYDLWEHSPVRFEDSDQHTQPIIDTLFPADALLCAGRKVETMVTRALKAWRGILEKQAFIVPNAMRALRGTNQEGDPSWRCLDNTGPRIYLVVECDFSKFARDGKTPSEWHDMVTAWEADGFTVADACAAILLYLATKGPLVLAVHSGGKSVHGWFACRNMAESGLRAFMRHAHRLGADHATMTRCQAVRMPDGLRDGKTPQRVYYFDPATIQDWRTRP